MRISPRLVIPLLAAAAVLAAVALAAPASAVPHPCKPGHHCPSPSPSPTPTPTPAPTPAPSPTGTACVTSLHSGSCPAGGAYTDPAIYGSNGFNTYVVNNMWACGPDSDTTSCGPQVLTAYDPGNWSVTSTQAAGNLSVLTYPDIQQLYGSPPLSGFSSLQSTFAESMSATAGTHAEAAYDIWLNNWADEVMIWVDNAGQGFGADPQVGAPVIGGQQFTVYTNGSEIIVSLDGNEQGGTADILATLQWLQGRGLLPASSTLTAIDFGWEISSTGGVPETFAVSQYSVTAAP